MVHVNGAITSTILKARFGDDVRKSSLHHNNDLTLVDLLLNVQRIFGIQGDNVLLKYKDHDGDLVTLACDSDLLLALNTVGSQLDVTVQVDAHAHELVSSVQQQVDQIKIDVERLLHSLASLDNLASSVKSSSIVAAPQASLHEDIVLQKSYEAPPSPVPSEKPELPATIDPSLQEQVDNFNHRPTHVEEDIPLESSFNHHQGFAPPPHVDSHNSSFSQPPIENFGSMPPPSATIPSFPTSNAALPPVQQEFSAPPPPQFQPPPLSASHSSVSSTPIPQGPPSQGPPSVYGGPQTPQQFNAPPQGPPSEQGFGGFAPPPTAPGPQGFAPPPQQGFAPPQQGFQAGGPPQGFQAPPPQQFGAPPSAGPGGPPQAFAPPSQQQGFAPPPQQPGFAPPPPSAGAPGNFAPPPQAGGPGGFAPPPQGFGAPPPAAGPGGFAPPPQGFGGAAPPSAGPPTFAPPPTGFPPGGPQGGNPFARGPSSGYRQSPYHQ